MKKTKKILKDLSEFMSLLEKTNQATKNLASYYLKLVSGQIPPPEDEATFISGPTDYTLPLNVHPEWHESPMFILMALATMSSIIFNGKGEFYGQIFHPPVN